MVCKGHETGYVLDLKGLDFKGVLESIPKYGSLFKK